MEVNQNALKEAIEKTHGGKANFLEAVPVSESFHGEPVWQGIVHVFQLEGHPTATKCYAWSSPIENTSKRRFNTVLQIRPINSPTDAVRAAIVEEYRQKRKSL